MPTEYKILARINSIDGNKGKALFHTKEGEIEPYFHRLLIRFRNYHLRALKNVPLDEYKAPFDLTSFKYQTGNIPTMYMDKRGFIVPPEDSIGNLCELTLTIVPFDFISKKKRVVGFTIRMLNAKIMDK